MRRLDFYAAAAAMVIAQTICGVLLGTLHQGASPWLAGDSRDPAR